MAQVKQDFEEIAPSFSETRQRFWPDLTFLVELVRDGEKILDAGCGNGRLLEGIWRKIDYVGLDSSPTLIKLAEEKYGIKEGVKFLVGDVLNLPFKDESFDKVFAIALFHHLPSFELRLQAAKELKRVLKPGGLAIITVWNLWQLKYLPYLIWSFFKDFLFGFKIDFRDAFIPWKRGRSKVFRYVHAFTLVELEKLLKEVGFRIKKAGYTHRDKLRPNIFAVAVKTLKETEEKEPEKNNKTERID